MVKFWMKNTMEISDPSERENTDLLPCNNFHLVEWILVQAWARYFLIGVPSSEIKVLFRLLHDNLDYWAMKPTKIFDLDQSYWPEFLKNVSSSINSCDLFQ